MYVSHCRWPDQLPFQASTFRRLFKKTGNTHWVAIQYNVSFDCLSFMTPLWRFLWPMKLEVDLQSKAVLDLSTLVVGSLRQDKYFDTCARFAT